jgi:hypothetical protein
MTFVLRACEVKGRSNYNTDRVNADRETALEAEVVMSPVGTIGYSSSLAFISPGLIRLVCKYI